MDEIRIAGFLDESLVNGPGIRSVVFAQGCNHGCKGCFNIHTHDINGGENVKIIDLADKISTNPLINGVTFSGGDPFLQGEAFQLLAKEIKSKFKGEINIWCYTGYRYEDILSSSHEGFMKLIKEIDVLVDGKYEEDKSHKKLEYRGSSNQRIIDVKKSILEKRVIIWREML